MYHLVNLKGGVGRAFEKNCRETGIEPREMIEAMIKNFVASKNMTLPPAPDMGDGLDKFTRTYLDMRDTYQRIQKLADKEVTEIKEQMTRIENHLLDTLNKNGVKNMATDSATFYREETIKPSCTDWSAFYKWIVEHDAFEFLERRVTKVKVQEYMEEQGCLPPGINVLRENVVRVRKGKDA